MSLTAHPPLTRRKKSTEIRSTLLARQRDTLLSQYVDSEWFAEWDKLPVTPLLIVTSAEAPGEILRVAVEYLKTRYALAVKNKEETVKNGEEEGEKSEDPSDLPHPDSSIALRMVGRTYKKLDLMGFQNFKLKTKEGAVQPTEYITLDLYDTVGMAKAVMSCIDKEIELFQQEGAEKHVSESSPFGDIVVYADRGRRVSMEDKHVVIADLNALFGLGDDYPFHAFFAVYDGHGGVEAAEYTKTHLHVNIVRSLHFKDNIEQAIAEGFAKTDINFLRQAERDNIASGCTCIVSIVRDNKLYTAWLGDSQAMLCRRGEAVEGMCEPHTPNREDEKQRIESLGGVVVWHGAWRVNGVLSVARSIGDRQLKRYVVSDCDQSNTELSNAESFMCLACDGLWDVMNAKDVIEFVDNYRKDSGPIPEVAKALVKRAINLDSADNISVVIIFFK
eukprot:Ihof_evm10s72 gene=Ihof_evmTU10s72